MSIQTDTACTLYAAIGDFNNSISHIGDCHTHINDAAGDFVEAMEKGDIKRGWVIEVLTGNDVTEAAKAAARGWMMKRDQSYPEWLEAVEDSARWAAQ